MLMCALTKQSFLIVQPPANSRKDHIVHFVDFRTVPKPLLVMEYLRLGNLEAQHKVSPISDSDMIVVFKQCLQGLCCLHEQKITHRDLKPENILVRSRTPIIHIKLADFGLAQDRSDLKTFCGSPMYAAPEIFLGQNYTNAVDIWSLAVIIMKYIYGFRQNIESENLEATAELRLRGQVWCNSLIEEADDWDSDKVIDFLTKYMLRWEPRERLSAAECLSTASEIGLFDDSILQIGTLMPRLESDWDTDNTDTDTEEASTIREPLWQSIGTPVRDEGNVPRPPGPCPSCIPDQDQVEQWPVRAEARSADESVSPVSCHNRSTERRRTVYGPPSLQRAFPLKSARTGRRRRPDTAKLEKFYRTKKAPTASDYEYLATETKMDMGAIRTWFQNRRYKDRQQLRELALVEPQLGEGFAAIRKTQPHNQPHIAPRPLSLPDKTPFADATCHMHRPEWEAEQSKYLSLQWRGGTIPIRRADHWISGTHLFKASGLTGQEINILKTTWDFELEVVSGSFPWAGTYIHYITGLQICQLYNFQELGTLIRESTPARLSRDKLPLQPEFSVIGYGETLISVRNDGYVNISHILLRIAQWKHAKIQKLRQLKKEIDFQVVRGGNRKQQGTYAEYSGALEICEEYQLRSVAECLRKFASRWSFGTASCEIPPLPQLPPNCIDHSATAKDDTPLSPPHHCGNHQVDSFVGISQQSHLSGIRPTLEPRSLSWHSNLFEASS
ncbi:hypothetical protein, variant [Cladophialophora immunda]|uniref:Serine/threonine-protein kinase ATG1 n=1 Tax=Cladophialophora immunda TaxID=569365 RepID=A0A0D2CMR7_9EURO|nr:hypothetical protein, variant [Cladophialophora immunda]KIW24859.1 hypothetical protein, variant [Cladophialophora immunda]